MAKKNPTNAEDFDIMFVDGDTARTWLANNVGNRRMSKQDVRRYAASMLAGHWALGNDAIMFNKQKQLHNGQHRLTALVLASETDPNLRIPFLVRWNTDDEEFDHVDQGKVRTAGDVLSTRPFAVNTTHAAAIARMVMCYDMIPDRPWSTTSYASSGINRDSVIEYAIKHQDMIEAIYVRTQAPMKLTQVNVLRYLVVRDSRHSEELEEFTEGLISGAGLSQGDPRLVLRNYLSGDAWRGMQWGMGQSMLGHHIVAWNKWVMGETSKLTRYHRNMLPLPNLK